MTNSAATLDKAKILPLLSAALREDIGPRDVTSQALIPPRLFAKSELVVREEGVVCGLQVAEWVFGLLEEKIRFKPTVSDGELVHPDKAVAYVEGPARAILMAERVALNFLARLSGIATLTRSCVEQARTAAGRRPSPAVMDTRKTTPNLRVLEKYAVAAGGGVPHRMGLYDSILIKDNHLKLVAPRAGGKTSVIETAVEQVRSKFSKPVSIEVEVSNLKEFRQALSAKADIILLDNMKPSEIGEAVRLRSALGRSPRGIKVQLEVSGGVTPDNVRIFAALGVDRISMGCLTHAARSLNVSLEVVG